MVNRTVEEMNQTKVRGGNRLCQNVFFLEDFSERVGLISCLLSELFCP